MRGALLLICFATSCGRIGFNPPSGAAPDGSDGPGSDGPGFDGPGSDGPPFEACGRTFPVPGTSAFTDDFSSAPLDARWEVFDGCVEQTGGTLVAMSLTAGTFCHAMTVAVGHLTCDQLFFRVIEGTSPQNASAQTVLYVRDDQSVSTLFYAVRTGNNYVFRYGNSASADPVEDRWWRLREEGGFLIFETAPDGLAWTERQRSQYPMLQELEAVRIAIGAGVVAGGSPNAAGRGVFDCYNIPPPCGT